MLLLLEMMTASSAALEMHRCINPALFSCTQCIYVKELMADSNSSNYVIDPQCYSCKTWTENIIIKC